MRSPLLLAALAAAFAAPLAVLAGAAPAKADDVKSPTNSWDALPHSTGYSERQCSIEAKNTVMVSLSRLPDAPLTVSLGASDGSVIELVFDRANGDSPHRVVRVRSGSLRIAITGDPLSVSSEDGKSSIRLQQSVKFNSDCKSNKPIAEVIWIQLLKPRELVGVPLYITIQADAALASSQPEAALALTGAPTAAGQRGLGLDSAIPAAVTELLQLLAEIAVDKAKSEAMRLFKDKVVAQVCDKLQLKLIDKTLGDGKTDAPLLPATCAQLENLRLGDLGGSAAALVTALREDVAGTVVPTLFTRLQDELLGRSIDPALVSLVTRLAARAASGGLTADEIKMALLAFVDSKTSAGSVESELLRAVVEVAIRCAVQGCTPADVLREIGVRLEPLQWITRIVLEQVVAAALDELDRSIANKETPSSQKVQASKAAGELRALSGEDYRALASALDKALTKLMSNKAPNLEMVIETVRVEVAKKFPDHAAKLQEAVNASKEVLKLQLARIGQDLLAQNKALEKLDLPRLAKAMPALAALAVRARAVLQPPAGTTPRAMASEAAQIFFDLLDITCADGAAPCAQRVHQFRDVIVGAIEADYIRALGGVSALLRVVVANLEQRATAFGAAKAAAAATTAANAATTAANNAKTSAEVAQKVMEAAYATWRAAAFAERAAGVLVADEVVAAKQAAEAAEKASKENSADMAEKAGAAAAAAKEVAKAAEQRTDAGKLRALAIEAKVARVALGMVASVMSYVETYKATTGEPPAEARARRKKALEALITAGTDRSGRAGGWVVSLGTTVGFVGGYRRLAGASDSDNANSAAYDLRLPLGLTAYRLCGDDGEKHNAVRPDGFLVHVSFADLALFVPSSADEAKPERSWSDFVAVGAQLGAGWGKQLPFVIGADISWAPGLVYKDGSNESRGVFRVGGFIGFNVPFLDLN